MLDNRKPLFTIMDKNQTSKTRKHFRAWPFLWGSVCAPGGLGVDAAVGDGIIHQSVGVGVRLVWADAEKLRQAAKPNMRSWKNSL